MNKRLPVFLGSLLLPSIQIDADVIIARYSGPRGRRCARKCGGNSKILRDADDDDLVFVDGDDACFEKIKACGSMIDVEIDNKIEGLTMFDGFAEVTQRSMMEVTTWGMEMIEVDDFDAGPHNVTVCVVDSGIAHGHPDFNSDNIAGTDTQNFFGPRRRWDQDFVGHGTHVAGILAAKAGNDEGISGASHHIKLHITRAIDDNGNGVESDITNAIEQCVEAGAKVINLSVGGARMNSRSNRLYRSVYHDYGAILVAAAGNGRSSAAVYPASHPDVISVAAVSESGDHWTGSSFGNQVELSAPGHRVYSTYASTAVAKVQDRDEGIDESFPAATIGRTLRAYATGELVRCDASEDKCKAKSSICVYAKSRSDRIADLLDACKVGEGIGAIIYSIDGEEFDNWAVAPPHDDFVAVGMRYEDVLNLVDVADYEEFEVTIGDTGADDQEYSYAYLTGTSMAAPHVAAAAALLWSWFPTCSNHQIRYALATTAEHPYGGDCDQYVGHGIVKVQEAYDWLDEQGDCSRWAVTPLSQGGCSTANSAIEAIAGNAGGLTGV